MDQQSANRESFDQEFSEEVDAEEQLRLEKEKREREEKREKDANLISKQLSQNLQIIIRHFKNNEQDFQVLKVKFLNFLKKSFFLIIKPNYVNILL